MTLNQLDEGPAPSLEPSRRLDSWKEIAAYLKRDVATVRRWEKREGLPVHRHLHEKLGSVFAQTSELDAWADRRRQTLDPVAASDAWRNSAVLPWTVAGVLALLLAAAVARWAPWRSESGPVSLRLSADLGTNVSLATVQFGDAATLSPDGATVAFVGQTGSGERQLYVRRLEQLQATPLSGTDGAIAPFFSPDGLWIGFFATGKLKKVAVAGGAPVPLADAPAAGGGAWGDDDRIVFSPHQIAGTRLMRVSSAGGAAEPLTMLEGDELIHLWPQVLPNHTAIIYTSGSVIGAYNGANIVAQSLTTGARKTVQPGGYHARYLSNGQLVFMHDGTLFAAPFDVDRLKVTGPPVAALPDVATNVQTGGAQFSVSENGTLLYLAGQGAGGGLPIYWMDHDAKTAPLRAAPANWINPRFAPDGRQLALEIRDAAPHIWIADWARDTLTRLSGDAAAEQKPIWTPDGQRLVFASARADRLTTNLYWRRADGTGSADRLTDSPNAQQPSSWHPNEPLLAFEEITPETRSDIMVLPVHGSEATGWTPGKPRVFLNGPSAEFDPVFSPDGRWIAYTSVESGRPAVYVRPFPGPGGKWLIGDGTNPTWSQRRNELFFGNNGQILVVEFTVDRDTFRPGKPHLWTDGRYHGRGSVRMFDLHLDGERLALAPAPSGARQDTTVFVFSFFDELRRAGTARR